MTVIVSDLLDYLLTPSWRRSSAWLDWPPDVFAVAGSLLHSSGAYVQAVEQWPPARERRRGAWAKSMGEIGKRWRRSTAPPGKPQRAPAEVRKWWQVVRQHALGRRGAEPLLIDNIGRTPAVCQALLQMVAAADEASAGAGIADDPGKMRDSFSLEATTRLWESAWKEQPATLCRRVPAGKAAVLPKACTPQNGITLRSLTHHLALVPGCGVSARWMQAVNPNRPSGGHHLNVMLVPWPLEMRPAQFQCAVPSNGRLQNMPDNYGFFAYDSHPNATPAQARQTADEMAAHIQELHRRAVERVGEVHGIILPEMALQHLEYEAVRQKVVDLGVTFLITGVYSPPVNGEPGLNKAMINARVIDDNFIDVEQFKHHRWSLDGRQIRQYGLGATLDPRKIWWEYTSVGDRTLRFLALGPWLTLAALICEDLARPDPVGEVIRAVGPTLVVALLQDGPQLTHRWSARYATVLADDPGSSVLSLTSLGMAQLSTPIEAGSSGSKSRVIAVWKDRRNGARELELPRGAAALVLCLTNDYEQQWTADGRDDGRASGWISLSGVHDIPEVTQADQQALSKDRPAATSADQGGGAGKSIPKLTPKRGAR